MREDTGMSDGRGVHIVLETDYEGDAIRGVFATEEQADAFMATHPSLNLSAESWSISLDPVAACPPRGCNRLMAKITLVKARAIVGYLERIEAHYQEAGE